MREARQTNIFAVECVYSTARNSRRVQTAGGEVRRHRHAESIPTFVLISRVRGWSRRARRLFFAVYETIFVFWPNVLNIRAKNELSL